MTKITLDFYMTHCFKYSYTNSQEGGGAVILRSGYIYMLTHQFQFFINGFPLSFTISQSLQSFFIATHKYTQ